MDGIMDKNSTKKVCDMGYVVSSARLGEKIFNLDLFAYRH
jgi:hypothetical protein